jgi:peptidoglycan hydrolase-like protein with peptidoglycan-binding domain
VRRAVAALLSSTVIASAALAASPARAAGPSRPPVSAAGWCHRTLAHYPVLVPGDRRAAVRTLQCALDDVGAGPVLVDGDYGRQTRAAVRRIENGFEGPAPHPGRIDSGFWVLLFGRQLPDQTLRLGDSGRVVRDLQRALRAAGLVLAVDGEFTRQTRRAVTAYQRAEHLRVTGRVDADTRFLLSMGASVS